MNDIGQQSLPIELEAAPTAPAPVRRRRRNTAKTPVPQPVTDALSESGGVAGLWRVLTGRLGGASLRGDSVLTLAFLTCLLVGTVLCLVGLMPFPLAHKIGLAGPLLATLAYPIVGWSIGAATKPSLRERLADNAYYLGFIFTQVALLVGFLPAALSDAELTANQIIRFFGIALGASLIGLIARTLLLQLSYTVDEAADVVTGEVSALARQVSEQSTLVLEHFEVLVARLAITSAKFTGELQSGMSGLVETVDAYNKALATDAATLHVGVAGAARVANQVAADVEEQQAELAEKTKSVAGAIGEMQAQLESHIRSSSEKISATTTALETEVRNSAQDLRSIAEAVQGSLESMRAISNLQDGVSLVDARLGALGDSLITIEGKVATVGGSFDGSLNRLETALQAAHGAAIERAATVGAETEQAVQALERVLRGFRAELDRLRT
jgi:hypothetical protein